MNCHGNSSMGIHFRVDELPGNSLIDEITRGSGRRSLPVSQGVWGAQPPSIARGPGGAAPRYCRGSGGRSPRYCRGSGGRSSLVLRGIWGAQPPSKAGGFDGFGGRHAPQFPKLKSWRGGSKTVFWTPKETGHRHM